MAPQSPPRTHAFDPTPALEHNRDNFSPFNIPNVHDYSLSNPSSSRAVHFSDPPASMAARHSIATTHVPLLPSVPSASKIPQEKFRITAPPPGIDIDAYIENCRNLNEQLRAAHETERKAWEIERTSFKSRIAELEFQLNKSRDPKRRSSNDSSANSAQSFRADFSTQWANGGSTINGSRKTSDSALITGPPVWKGPESTPPVTRVFSHDDDLAHLPSISEDEPFPALSQEISPTNKEDAVPIPIEQVEPTLDGITLKSTGPGLTSSFVAKISSPQFSASPARSLSPRPPRNTLSAGTGNPPNLALEMKNLLDPLDEKLKRFAGHTPMAFDGQISTGATSTDIPTPKVENPVEPAPSTRPPYHPSENSDSYFSDSSIPRADQPAPAEEEEEALLEPQDDPSLSGPLMLDPSAKSHAAHTFLDQVDAKLMAAAEAADSSPGRGRSETLQTEDGLGGTVAPIATAVATNGKSECDPIWEDDEGDISPKRNGRGKDKSIDDDMPRLKMKSSTNFGSAWGHVPGVS